MPIIFTRLSSADSYHVSYDIQPKAQVRKINDFLQLRPIEFTFCNIQLFTGNTINILNQDGNRPIRICNKFNRIFVIILIHGNINFYASIRS